ncbi:hypothetical protein Q9L58_009800 [Maublancomyces gigas]|uniref:Uncharacterized protein n=1 Tax=Discina gigas TaxID=1032678 RepID=A0ABR3G653_9PEZI
MATVLDLFAVMSQPLEKMKLVLSLNTRYDETGEISYLDNAIWLLEGVIAANPPAVFKQSLQSLLPGLIQKKAQHIDSEKIAKVVEENASVNVDGGVPSELRRVCQRSPQKFTTPSDRNLKGPWAISKKGFRQSKRQ